MGTLTAGTTVIDIPDDMSWPGEFAWPAVAQRKAYSVTGSLVVEAGRKAAGRTITLQADQDAGWMPRSDVEAIQTLLTNPAVDPSVAMTLLFRGQTFSVLFDHEAGALDATPIFDYSDPDAADSYMATIRFITIA